MQLKFPKPRKVSSGKEQGQGYGSSEARCCFIDNDSMVDGASDASILFQCSELHCCTINDVSTMLKFQREVYEHVQFCNRIFD